MASCIVSDTRRVGFVLDFVAKTQNPSVLDPRFKEFTIPSSLDFLNGYIDEMLFCPIITLRKSLSSTEQCRPACANLFVSATKKKWVSQNTISFWIRSVINHTCRSATDED